MGAKESQASELTIGWFEKKCREGSLNSKSCFVPKCENEASVMCKCIEKGLFSCHEHFAQHTTKGYNLKSHALIPIATQLGKSDRKRAMKNAKILIKSLMKIESTAIENSSNLINCINSSLTKFLSVIREKEFQIINFAKKIKEEKMVLIDFVNLISKAPKCVFNYNPEIGVLISDIENAYNYTVYDSQIENDQLSFDNEILLFNQNLKISAITLETLTARDLDFSPNLGAACAVSKISEDKYFIQGGYTDCWRAEAYIIDLKNNDFEALPSLSENGHAGCVYKDNSVYIFGGCNNNAALSECYAFDIETKRFSYIQNLPQPSHSNTAAQSNKKIYVSGYELDQLYIFANNSYWQALALSAYTPKIVFSGWIVINNMIYEEKDKGFTESSLYFNGYSLTYLNSCCTSKWKHFLYFVDSNQVLIRINLEAKVLEQVSIN